MIQTATRTLLCALACAFAAAQAGAQPYGDPYAYPQRPYAAGPGRIVHCESNDWRRNFCAIPIRPNDRVTVIRRFSDRGCVPGRTWFTEPNGIWVDDGCRADFLVVARRPARPPARYLGPRDRMDDRDDRDHDGNRYRDDRDDAYGPPDRPMPPPDRYDDDRGPPPQAYDRDPQRHGTVTVRDPDDPQDRGRRMDDCDSGNGDEEHRDDCGPPTTPDMDRR